MTKNGSKFEIPGSRFAADGAFNYGRFGSIGDGHAITLSELLISNSWRSRGMAEQNKKPKSPASERKSSPAERWISFGSLFVAVCALAVSIFTPVV
ncbi:MAG TPA: hypothetical protein VNN77_01270 [candidate division Zixibacteria bacterium]|nr:hypothetical protein [candidate division Zixibacteria bacterium]